MHKVARGSVRHPELSLDPFQEAAVILAPN
jgi:hypothetical protein